MKSKRTKTLAAFLTLCLPLAAGDVVLTKDGSKLTGTITLIDQGIIHMKTPYAGAIQLRQDQVASFETETPVVVRLESGTVMSGPVESSKGNRLKIRSEDGVLQTDVSRVAASWSTGAEDPAVVRNRRGWTYSASLDVNGETGTTEQFEVGATVRAQLEGPDDALGLYLEYEQAEEEGLKTDDRVEGGADYENFFGETLGWFARTEVEQDRIDRIDLRSLSSLGLSYRLIEKPAQSLILRSGAGYEFTSYSNNLENDSSATLEFALNHDYTFKDDFSIKTELVYIPLVEDFGDFTLEHDTGIEIPLGSSENWKIRLGVNNEYESEPASDERLDTTYYTKMIYSWD